MCNPDAIWEGGKQSILLNFMGNELRGGRREAKGKEKRRGIANAGDWIFTVEFASGQDSGRKGRLKS